jgi:hypothetical protein
MKQGMISGGGQVNNGQQFVNTAVMSPKSASKLGNTQGVMNAWGADS